GGRTQPLLRDVSGVGGRSLPGHRLDRDLVGAGQRGFPGGVHLQDEGLALRGHPLVEVVAVLPLRDDPLRERVGALRAGEGVGGGRVRERGRRGEEQGRDGEGGGGTTSGRQGARG